MIDTNSWKKRSIQQNCILQTTPCAVLVPIVQVDGEEHLLFEVRSPKLGWQPGDICFPGGSIEAEDATPWQTAQRETQEELGITPAHIQLWGPLDYVESPVGVLVYPYAAAVDATTYTLNKREVDRVFTVPLAWLRKTRPEVATIDIATKPTADFPKELLGTQGDDWVRRRPYQVYIYRYGRYIIWGITAQIIRNFLDLYEQMTK